MKVHYMLDKDGGIRSETLEPYCAVHEPHILYAGLETGFIRGEYCYVCSEQKRRRFRDKIGTGSTGPK